MVMVMDESVAKLYCPDHACVNTRTPLLQHFVKQIRRLRLAQRRPSKLRAMEPLQVRRKERHGRAILAET